ncbi:2-amino-4-hydroxy-6-hydroxymethyldihydropteridine diphosphokinase [Ruminiclostridium sufflavum]|nr:2-amino-4-hydroxy-6-hydroxymethyldihydropteridine diphosphokinase [Ruminiclostridium sufflavum]
MKHKRYTAYIGIGSNMGDRESNLRNAIALLNYEDKAMVTAVSSFINTAPVGYAEQPDFLNAVVEIATALSPQKLLWLCSEIENKLKRKRTIRWGPRTIDLDILLYNDLILNEDNLIIPHPRMSEREFVLKPLKEIAPGAFHPVLKKTIEEIYCG